MVEMHRTALYFTAVGKVELRQEIAVQPNPQAVWVRQLASAISTGTELLLYRGQAPQALEADSAIAALAGSLQYPLKYGYCWVGQTPNGERVFSFQPHQSGFWGTASDWLLVPPEISLEDALFLPNMETAVNLVQDAAPRLGERVLLLGLGIVGQLTLALLAQFPLETLHAVDMLASRREHAAQFSGVSTSAQIPANEYDLVLELTGNPAVLDLAINACGFGGRVLVGSWYGTKTAPLQLGAHFHRNRISLYSTQVSTIAPELRGRWDKARRFATVWQKIGALRPARLITQQFLLAEAQTAYELLDQHPEQALQVIFRP